MWEGRLARGNTGGGNFAAGSGSGAGTRMRTILWRVGKPWKRARPAETSRMQKSAIKRRRGTRRRITAWKDTPGVKLWHGWKWGVGGNVGNLLPSVATEIEKPARLILTSSADAGANV